MAEEQLATTSLGKTHSDWAEKLRHIDLEDLEFVRKFASGNNSVVSLVQLRGYLNSSFALKTMRKIKISDQDERQNLLSERKILAEVQSDFIVRFYRTFKDKEHLHLLTEYLPGGELWRLLKNGVSESDAKFYIACVVEALDCLQKQNITHNDIKPTNLVLDAEGYVKVVDFGYALKLEPGGVSSEDFNFGTPEYMPPEIFEGRDKAGDLWALGVSLYELLSDISPFAIFSGLSNRKILRNIKRGIDSVEFPQVYFSEEARDIIRQLCKHDPKSRLGYNGMDEIRQHRWFDGFDWKKLRDRQLPAPTVPELENVIDTRNFSGLVGDFDSDADEDDSDWDKEF